MLTRQRQAGPDDSNLEMTRVARDPVMVFRFALREGDLRLAGALVGVLRGRATRRRLEREIARRWGREGPSLGALRAVALLTRLLGLVESPG